MLLYPKFESRNYRGVLLNKLCKVSIIPSQQIAHPVNHSAFTLGQIDLVSGRGIIDL